MKEYTIGKFVVYIFEFQISFGKNMSYQEMYYLYIQQGMCVVQLGECLN